MFLILFFLFIYIFVYLWPYLCKCDVMLEYKVRILQVQYKLVALPFCLFNIVVLWSLSESVALYICEEGGGEGEQGSRFYSSSHNP